MASPGRTADYRKKVADTRKNMEACWKVDIDWNIYPESIRMGCEQVGRALSVSPSAVLSGLIILISFFVSHSEVTIAGTAWIEPVIIWLTIGIPTGCGKSSIFKYLLKLVNLTRTKLKVSDSVPSWNLDEATFEKMGALMNDNGGRLLGIYDEMTTFLTQINLYKSRGQVDSHDVAVFLQLYNGHPWSRKTVTGDANFIMERTSLTVGGFTQPMVARQMIEQQGSSEKGLAQRFMWMFPQPLFAKFCNLEPVDEKFMESLVNLFAAQFQQTVAPRAAVPCRSWHLPEEFPDFVTKHDKIQAQLEKICGHDDLISGFLSKAKGQTLRVAVCLHILFNIESPNTIPAEISENALKAAINFTDVCCTHASLITGRGKGQLSEGEVTQTGASTDQLDCEDDQLKETARYTLLLPGKNLDLTTLNNAKKFRNKGNKEGGLQAFRQLENSGLGTIEDLTQPGQKTKHYTFWKVTIPEDSHELSELSARLLKYNISLKMYSDSFGKDDIGTSTPRKRLLE